MRVLILFTAWDWLATASIRLGVEQDIRALAIAAITTAFWWLSVSLVKGQQLLTAAVAGAVLGTYLGMNWS